MKCPRCEFVTSDKNEQCPRCALNFKHQDKPTVKKHKFEDLISAVDKILEHRKVQKNEIIRNFKSDSSDQTEQLTVETPVKQKSQIPVIDIQKEILDDLNLPNFNYDSQTSVVIEAETTEVENPKASYSDLAALAELTEEIAKIEKIEIPQIEWKKGEIEMAKITITSDDLGFVEVLDLNEDNEISVLFELAEREILNPTIIATNLDSQTRKAKIETNLDKAFEDYEKAHDHEQAMKKLNIHDSTGVTLISETIIQAKIWRRILAFIIDFSLNFLACSLYTWINLLPHEVRSRITNFESDAIFDFLPYLSGYITTFISLWVIMQCALLATIGSTVGCKIMKIAITDKEGLLLSFKQSLLRSLSWSVTILSFGLGSLMVFFNHRQTLHDRIAKTIVVQVN